MSEEKLYLVQDDTEYLAKIPPLTDEQKQELDEVSKQLRELWKQKYGI